MLLLVGPPAALMKSSLLLFLSLLLLLASPTTTLAYEFPISTRQALAAKAKAINPPQQKLPVGWSNRAGTVLTPIHPESVYTGDRPFYWNNIDVGCRMTVIELESSSQKSDKPDLWIHSPVALDGPMYQAITQLGTVKYIVSPNYEHLKFAKQWHDTFPDAQCWGCPGLEERLPEIRFTGEIPWHHRPNNEEQSIVLPWNSTTLQALHIDCETNPFTGKPFFNEVVYYHQPTQTLIVTDLFWNYPTQVPNAQFGRDDSWELAPTVDSIPVGSRLWKFGMVRGGTVVDLLLDDSVESHSHVSLAQDQIYYPFYNNFMVHDKAAYGEMVQVILEEWEVATIVPAHGDILRGTDFCRSVLQKHFQVESK